MCAVSVCVRGEEDNSIILPQAILYGKFGFNYLLNVLQLYKAKFMYCKVKIINVC